MAIEIATGQPYWTLVAAKETSITLGSRVIESMLPAQNQDDFGYDVVA
jgi:hypothetical protein